MLYASVRWKQKRLQRLSEPVPANNRIPQAVRQGIPDRRTSHTESPSAIGAELVARYDQEPLGGGSEADNRLSVPQYRPTVIQFLFTLMLAFSVILRFSGNK